jgi:uncharacterized protein
MTAVFAAAALAGFLGSLHCVGMCGPLVTAGVTASGAPRWSLVAQYFLGRAVSYGFVGALMGQLGEHALCRLPVGPVQWAVWAGALSFAGYKAIRSLFPSKRTPAALPAWLAPVVQWIPRRGLGLGLATGFLPCAMLVPAWLMAASTGSALGGAGAMLSFSLGAIPALLTPVLGVGFLHGRWRSPVWLQSAAWWALTFAVAVRPWLSAVHAH